MKKLNFIYFALLCLASLPSCSQGDSPDGGGRGTESYIFFRTNLSDVSPTRGSQLTIDGFNKFNVTAFFGSDASTNPYFDKKSFTKGSDNKFTSIPGYVWPATNMDFYAWWNESGSCTLSNGTANYTMAGFKVDSNIANHVDFVTAHTKTTFGNFDSDETNGVSLVFDHRLCQIGILALNASTKYTVEVAGVRFGNVPLSGTFNFNGDATHPYWADTSSGIIEYKFGDADQIVTLGTTATSIMGKGGNAMVIPTGSISAWNPKTSLKAETGTYISVLIRVTMTEGSRTVQLYPAPGLEAEDEVEKTTFKGKEFAWAAVPVGVSWEPGKYYTYTLNYSLGVGIRDPKEPNHPADPILGGDVTATVTLNEWKVEKSTTIPVPGTNGNN